LLYDKVAQIIHTKNLSEIIIRKSLETHTHTQTHTGTLIYRDTAVDCLWEPKQKNPVRISYKSTLNVSQSTISN